jgi:FixJ family two-component response regulator
MCDTPTVFVIDDDPAFRDSMGLLLSRSEMRHRLFGSAEDFLRVCDEYSRGCAVIDVRLQGMNGLECQEQLRLRNVNMPVIMVTGHADVPMAIRAMKAGAVDFLEKPFEGGTLLHSVRTALQQDQDAQAKAERIREAKIRVLDLTVREREVLRMVSEGLLSKEIAAELDISTRTVEAHRARILRKTNCDTLADLIRLAVAAGI